LENITSNFYWFVTYIPPRRTAISVVHHIYNHVSFCCIISIPIPIAAAIGSWIKYTSLPFTLSQDSLPLSYFNSVIPEGIQTTICKAGTFFQCRYAFINILSFFLKHQNQQLHHLSGLIVLMFSCVLPCIKLALYQQQWFYQKSVSVHWWLSITTLSLCMIKVLAVPRSIAISSVMKSKNPISFRVKLYKSVQS
jgi:hypothetical protein